MKICLCLCEAICNRWHHQWHKGIKAIYCYWVNQQKRLNIIAKCHNSVFPLIIDCKYDILSLVSGEASFENHCACFNKMTWKGWNSPVMLLSSVHPSKEPMKLKGYLKLLKLYAFDFFLQLNLSHGSSWRSSKWFFQVQYNLQQFHSILM